MTERRPDPDELPERVVVADERQKRGKLTIFFGAAPGVGKTYTMLDAARLEISDAQRDVVVGVVETHGRYDTGAMMIGLELVPRRIVEHRGLQLEELDLDAVIARRPDLVLVDELAHTNVPGGRHLKRWQDVAEILDAGIDVFTTLNVQHLESLKDVVAQITGVVVREAVPDSVFEKADEVRVVDLPVAELLERLREGKVYVPEQAAGARESFFQRGNLIALRELALRRTAERVDAQMRVYKAEHGIDESWHTGERILVCVSPSPSSAKVIRAARRMATSLHAELLGLYVETPGAIRMSGRDRETLASHMRLVEALDGEPITVRAENPAVETVRYARKRNVTKIVLGKPTHPRWRDVVRQSFLDEVVRQSSEIDVYVISGSADGDGARLADVAVTPKRLDPRGYAWGALAVAVATAVAWFGVGRAELADVVMIHLLGIVLVAMRFGQGPSIFATILSVLSVDVMFVEPYFSLVVTDLHHLATFGVMFVVAVVISHLTKRVRDQADSARERERRTASLYSISRELGLSQSRGELLTVAAKHLHEVFEARVAVYLPAASGRPDLAFTDGGGAEIDERDRGIVDWVWLHRRPAGLGTDTLPTSRALVVPLRGSRGCVGVLSLAPSVGARLDEPDARQLVETFGGLIGSAIERTQLADEARQAGLRAETERMRNALLSSVSHDLRTPLGVVTGATSALLDEEAETDAGTRRELLQTAHDEAERLSRLVRNLLDMTRLEAGALTIKKSATSLEEVVGSALGRTADRLRGREVTTDVPSDLVAACDSSLIEQVVINVVENATKYSPPNSAISVTARRAGDMVELDISDRGPGVPIDQAERIFEKFYRAKEAEGGGAGLGLTICRGIVQAHGGTIRVIARDGGGATFRIAIPSES